eukprot:2914495-Prymnesium_polylepis.1
MISPSSSSWCTTAAARSAAAAGRSRINSRLTHAAVRSCPAERVHPNSRAAAGGDAPSSPSTAVSATRAPESSVPARTNRVNLHSSTGGCSSVKRGSSGRSE